MLFQVRHMTTPLSGLVLVVEIVYESTMEVRSVRKQGFTVFLFAKEISNLNFIIPISSKCAVIL